MRWRQEITTWKPNVTIRALLLSSTLHTFVYRQEILLTFSLPLQSTLTPIFLCVAESNQLNHWLDSWPLIYI